MIIQYKPYGVCCRVLLRVVCLGMACVSASAALGVEVPAQAEVKQKGQPVKGAQGGDIYRANCVLCHGEKGLGDGRMAKVITAPPPANLTKSRRSKAYMKKIITYGGGIMGRSPQMPVWGQELDEQQIKAVVDYIYRLRER